MVWWTIVETIGWWLGQFAAYVIVDHMVKGALRDARSDGDRYRIWLMEAAGLVVLFAATCLYYDPPYILLAMAILTLVATQDITRHVVLRIQRKWQQMHGMWSEFEREYDEYRTHSRDEKRDAVFNAMVAQQTVANAAPSPSYATSPWMAHNYLYRRLPAEPWYPEDNNKQKPAVPNFLKQQSIPAVSKPMSPSLTNHVSKEPVQHLDPVSLSTAPIGMMNAGASMCFVNTVLQCLAHIPGLPQELAGGRQPPPGSQGAVFINMVTSLMLELNCHAPTTEWLDATCLREIGATLPNSLLAPLTRKQPQQDVAEFLQWLLGYIHNQTNWPVPTRELDQSDAMLQSLLNAQPAYMNHTSTPDRQTAPCIWQKSHNPMEETMLRENQRHMARLEWRKYKAANQSTVDSMFTGQILETRRCLGCGRAALSCSTFNVLPVPLAAPQMDGVIPLASCLQQLGKEVAQANGLRCEQCLRNNHLYNSPLLSPISQEYFPADLQSPRNRHDSGFHEQPPRSSTPSSVGSEYQSRGWLSVLPECLVMQLCRFSCREGEAHKDTRPVHIPIHHLPLTDLLLDSPAMAPTYELQAFCVHHGSPLLGHYTCYARIGKDWYYFDDTLIKQVDINYECRTRQVRENAYLFFYCKKR